MKNINERVMNRTLAQISQQCNGSLQRIYTMFIILVYFLTVTYQSESITAAVSSPHHYLEIHTNKPNRCAYENVLSNHTFRRNKQAGVFTHLGHTTDIHQCKELCCKRSDCDVAFMPENHCYGVSCYSDQHCETTPANAEAFNVKLVKVRRVVIPGNPMEVSKMPEEDEIIRSSLPEVMPKKVTTSEQKLSPSSSSPQVETIKKKTKVGDDGKVYYCKK